MTVVLMSLIILIVTITVLFIIPNLLIAIILYRLMLVRTHKSKWSRGYKKIKGKDQENMYFRGIEWAKENEDFKSEVSVCNNGLNLYGEYFNFGFKKAVIIIPGHSEGCKYSYYYAIPYRDFGYNVLVIDNRCNGLSDGKYLTFGLKECTDIILWGELLNKNFAVDYIVLHGICMGAATALHTLTSENIPFYFKGMIADGMYQTFYEIFLNHVVAFKQPKFPVPQIVFFMIEHFSKVDAINNGPIYSINQLKKPILFIHSKQDIFSLPTKAMELYEKCSSPKQIVWFDKGSHSHLRITDEAKYDKAISDFVNNFMP